VAIKFKNLNMKWYRQQNLILHNSWFSSFIYDFHYFVAVQHFQQYNNNKNHCCTPYSEHIKASAPPEVHQRGHPRDPRINVSVSVVRLPATRYVEFICDWRDVVDASPDALENFGEGGTKHTLGRVLRDSGGLRYWEWADDERLTRISILLHSPVFSSAQ